MFPMFPHRVPTGLCVGDGGCYGGQRDDRAAGGVCPWTADPAGEDQGGAGSPVNG